MTITHQLEDLIGDWGNLKEPSGIWGIPFSR